MALTKKILAQSGGGERPLCIFIPTLTAGGAERVASILANVWCDNRSVIIVTYFDLPAFFRINPRIKIECLGLKSNRGMFLRTFDIMLASWRFRRLISRLSPEFVVSFMNKYNAFCLASLFGLPVPVIVSERDSPTEKLPRSRIIARDVLYPFAAGLICQTDRGRDFITARTRIKRSAVIPNPVDPMIEPSSRDAEKIILGVGRFVPKKGFDQLITSFAAMNDESWRLVLCGDGPLREQLIMQAEALGVSRRMELPGLVSDLGPYLSRAGIFAFPSLYEGFPNALAEAMVSGLACISYDCPTGPSDLIDDGKNGVLIPVGDVAAMTAALDRLAADRDFAERLGARAGELAAQLDPAHVSAEYLAFCEAAARPDAHA